MSHEAAQAFIEKMKSDEAFRARGIVVEDVAGRLELINAEAFDCTVEEIEPPSGALADGQLTGVAGGIGYRRPGLDAWEMT